MSRVIHFEIHAADVPRAVAFYAAVFGWKTEDWSQYAGMPYIGVITGEEGQPGINGAIMQRMSPNMEVGGPVAGAVLNDHLERTAHDAARLVDLFDGHLLRIHDGRFGDGDGARQ